VDRVSEILEPTKQHESRCCLREFQEGLATDYADLIRGIREIRG
jgi:hypothetical protein